MISLISLFGVLGVLLTLGVALGGLRIAQVRWGWHPEVVRKALHVAMGLVVLVFPMLFEDAGPVLVLGVVSTVLMAGVRRVKALRQGVGSVLHAVERASWGEMSFAPAVACVFVLSGGEGVLYTVPILLLTFADPAAALVGMRCGQVRYRTLDGWKSAEGSAAFFAVAFLAAYVAMAQAWVVGASEALMLALLMAGAATLIEAVSWRGLDNLFVPVGSFLVLYTHLGLGTPVLAERLVVLVGVVALVGLAKAPGLPHLLRHRLYHAGLAAATSPISILFLSLIR